MKDIWEESFRSLFPPEFGCWGGARRMWKITVIPYSLGLNRCYIIVLTNDTLQLNLAQVYKVVPVQFYSGQNSSHSSQYNLYISYLEIENSIILVF